MEYFLLYSNMVLNIYSFKRLVRASLTFGYISLAWREAVVVFILKTSYRPISLTSFLLKTIADQYIRSESLSEKPLHAKTFAYQAGKSTINALQCPAEGIEKTLTAKEMFLCVFIDIESSFHNTCHTSIKRSLEVRTLPVSLIWCTQSKLRSRLILASLEEETTKITTEKGCPKGGAVLPIMWSIFVDDLIRKLNDNKVLLVYGGSIFDGITSFQHFP